MNLTKMVNVVRILVNSLSIEYYTLSCVRWEPLIEVAQFKGDGETHLLLSPEDEFANFETWDVGNIDGSAAKTDDMLPSTGNQES